MKRLWGAAALWAMSAASALAAEPVPWEMGFQPAATPVRERIDALHDELLIIITLISLFVLGLLLYVMLRFNAKRHPVASKTTHNPVLEFAWTLVPIVILLTIAIPSFKLLFYMDRTPNAEMTLKVTGHQWYWTYAYPDQGNISFDSRILCDSEDAKCWADKKAKRLLDVDNPVVVPVGTNIRVLVGGEDVIHSWFVPAIGVQEYAVVGRTNESWMNLERPGVYYGQCNQICGLNHPFMPIAVQAVSKDDFQKWLADAKTKFARDDEDAAGLRLAAAQRPASERVEP